MTLVRLYLIGFLLYGVAVAGGMLWALHLSGAGPHTKLKREVAENQYIEASDLAPVDQNDIAGHYARWRMNAGETITAADVSSGKSPPPKSSLAVVASYPLLQGRKPLRPGDAIRLCLDSKALLAEPVPVDAAECDASSCAATVLLKDIPKELGAEGALTRLRVAAGPSEDCAAKPPP